MKDLIKTRCSERGLCCESCQENVNCHECSACNGIFYNDDTIFCESHSISDSKHYHQDCKPKEDKKKVLK